MAVPGNIFVTGGAGTLAVQFSFQLYTLEMDNTLSSIRTMIIIILYYRIHWVSYGPLLVREWIQVDSSG